MAIVIALRILYSVVCYDNHLMKHYFLAFYKPKRAFELLLANSRYFKLAFLYIFIPTAAYTLMYVFLTIAHGASSAFTPWLNISKENYCAVGRFLLAPSMLLFG
ncbi:MAG: hypothetical protein U0V74_06775 [Chitinophagales bacterium]